MNKKNNILMISSTSQKGGGPKHMFLLREIFENQLNIFIACPKIDMPEITANNYIEISERKITVFDTLRLIFFIKKNSIKIVHCHGKGAGAIGRLLKLFINIKLVYTFHGIHIKFYGLLGRYLYIIYERLMGILDDYKVFVSTGELSYAKENKIYIGKNYKVIENAVKNKKIRLLNNLDKKNIFNDYQNTKNIFKVNIISICRLVDQKNIFEIFEIAKLLKNFRFNIIGNGYLATKAKLFLEKEGINNVVLYGQKNNIYNFLYDSDLFLSTSLYEGLPLSLIEAMSIGLPVVASNVVGNRDVVINNKTGFLYQLGKYDIAAESIQRIINSDKLIREFSQNSFERQRKYFSISNMKKKYLSLYGSF